MKMWACDSYQSDNEYDDWTRPQSPELDEEAQEAEDRREIEHELFSRLHHDYHEEEVNESASNSPVPEIVNPPEDPSEYTPIREVRPFLRTKTGGSTDRDYHCYICEEKGHLSRDCTEMKRICIFCGENGHYKQHCPLALCYNCNLPGHRFRECSVRNSNSRCFRCEMVGHTQLNCPDLWRRYRYTTSSGPLIKSKCKNTRVYCYNCGKRGHYGHDCGKEPMNPHIKCRYPFVVSYDPNGTHYKNHKRRRMEEDTPEEIHFAIPDGKPKVTANHKSSKRKKKFAQSHSENGFKCSLQIGSFKPKVTKKSNLAKKIRKSKKAAMKKKKKKANLRKDI